MKSATVPHISLQKRCPNENVWKLSSVISVSLFIQLVILLHSAVQKF